MGVVMSLNWAGVTPEQYDAVRRIVNWEDATPEGAVMHAAWFDSSGLRITDVWDSREDFERFMAGRVMPAVAQVGVAGEPDVKVTGLHRRFVAPGVSGAGN
jgi:hypothetical protein